MILQNIQKLCKKVFFNSTLQNRDFAFSNSVLILSSDYFYNSFVRAYTSFTLQLCFKICLYKNLINTFLTSNYTKELIPFTSIFSQLPIRGGIPDSAQNSVTIKGPQKVIEKIKSHRKS